MMRLMNTLLAFFQLDQLEQLVIHYLPAFALKVIAALAMWFIGHWLIVRVVRLLAKVLSRGKKIDATLSKYLQAIVQVALIILLVMSILDVFGVSTTSFAALLAGAGLAIGTAWGGLLTHFAAGVFMQVLRPYKVGDVVSVSGVTGKVKELGLFATTLVTADNVVTILGNNKVFADTIKNYSAMPVRRVDCQVKIANSVDLPDAIARLKAALAQVPNVLTDPPPDVGVLEITPEGPLLYVRPHAQLQDYWQVYSDAYIAIVDAFKHAGYPIPCIPSAAAPASWSMPQD